jgi:predicted DNA-binding transcriptional regulator AlpA
MSKALTARAPLYLDVKQVAARLSASTRSVYRWVQHGILPRPINITKRSARWDAAEVAEAVAKLAGRL